VDIGSIDRDGGLDVMSEKSPLEKKNIPMSPLVTYRIQFNAGFTFDDAADIAAYLQSLGISHLYASPWLKSRSGSTHGYDIVDHNAFNPELGGSEGFERLATALLKHDLKHILDFVPNHMGVARADNPWWLDVLEWGEASPYAAYFDIDWKAVGALRGQLLLPFLGDQYGRVLEAGELVPRFDAESGTYSLWYYDHRFPISPLHYGELIRLGAGDCERLRPLAEAFDAIAGEHCRDDVVALKAQLTEIAAEDSKIAEGLAHGAEVLCGKPGDPESFRPLHELIERQHYRLAFWGVASDEINYRRFFNINELAGIRIENPQLFEDAHRLVARLIAEDKLHGLRIDHIDGLFNPAEYCAKLRALTEREGNGRAFFITVEKILARHEYLPENWAVDGTTGYEFLGALNDLFVDQRGEGAMTRAYHRFVERPMEFDELLRQAKRFVMEHMMAGELAVLARRLDSISEQHWTSRDFTLAGLRAALGTVVAEFPVYRTYVTEAGVAASDRRDIAWAIARARQQWFGPGRGVFAFIESILTCDIADGPLGYVRSDVVNFAMRVQQFSGPIMAKSLEDTTFYRYHRLRSLNEVGSDPRQFGISVSAFHRLNQERAQRWPRSMLATATHDTKLGEDVRARINVLSEIPAEWSHHVTRWAHLNRRAKQRIEDFLAPRRNDEYLLYQTLLGAWPLVCDWHTAPASQREAFIARIQGYMQKAVREAGVQSSWATPDAEYEEAINRFIAQILDLRRGKFFLRSFLPFQQRVAEFGMRNSLAQLVLKLTSPGVADIYQGTELWDLNLVDPDNRRPVDFALRMRFLKEIEVIRNAPDEERCVAVSALMENWQDGCIKLYLMRELLALRSRFEKIFSSGHYQPLEAEKNTGERLCAFQRSAGEASIIVAVGRLFADANHTWAETTLNLPEGTAFPLVDVLTGRQWTDAASELSVQELFSILPVAVLVAGPKQ
jgi:(1->4)-alpha-D-glucan 1-alpha-D-glucosylmutase